MANIEWMQALLKEADPSPRMYFLMRVDEWLVASDGKFLCAVKSDENPPPFEEKWNTTAEIRKILATPLGSEDFDLSHLKAWSTRPEPPCIKCKGTKKVRCGDCKGTHRVKCTCDCGDEHSYACDSCVNGFVECPCMVPSIPATIFGECVDVIVLHRAIKSFSGMFRVSKNEIRSNKPLVFGGDDWRAAVMPTKTEPKEVYEPQRAVLA